MTEPSTRAPFIVAIGGGLHANSTTERALRVALAAAERSGARVELFTGECLDLPFYHPDLSRRTPAASRLVEALRQAGGVLIGSPAYHGGLSGVLKNALDYAEDLKDDARPYLDGRAVGCIATGAGWHGASATLWALRSVAHALRGWPTPLGVGINTAEPVFDPDGKCRSPGLQKQLEVVGEQVTEFARRWTD